MSYPLSTKNTAIEYRRKGYSIYEIARRFHIAVSTASLWVGTIPLNNTAKRRLQKNQILGQYKSAMLKRAKSQIINKQYLSSAKSTLEKVPKHSAVYKLLASFLLWTEGGKSAQNYVSFINSDPHMIKTFLILLRKAFTIDKTKLRGLVHIHEYHNDKQIRKFWSTITSIPLTQFSKSYQKPHTGKRIRKGYQGSCRIRYYDVKIAKELRAIYNTFAQQIGA